MDNIRQRLTLRMMIILALVAAVSIAIAISMTRTFVIKREALRISAGSGAGKRHEIAMTLVRIAEKKGLTLKPPVATGGSVETLKLITQELLDVGLIQGGLLKYLRSAEDAKLKEQFGKNFIEKDELAKIQQISAFDTEPLHLLFKPELLRAGIKGIKELKGKKKTLNLSDKGSGTYVLSRQLLDLIHFEPDQDYLESHFSYEELESLSYNKLPDAVFTVSALRSPVADHLIKKYGYKLVEIPYGDSLAIENPGIQSYTIKKNVYSNQDEPVETVGTTLLLVANARVSDEDIEKLLDAASDLEFTLIVNHPPAPEQPPEYALHPGVERYNSRNQPIITQEILRSRYVVNGLLFLILIVLVVNLRYAWLKQRSEQEYVKQKEDYSNYHKQVSEVEQELEDLKRESPEQFVPRLERLRRNLIEIRDRANSEIFDQTYVDPAILELSDWLQRYINSVISSVERLLNAARKG